jgi:PAS domain S-box-containing protein
MDDIKPEGMSKEETVYRNIFDNMLEVLYRADNEQRITLISPAALKMFGYDRLEDLIGKTIPETFYKNPSDRSLLLDELSTHGKVVNYPLVLKRKDGTILHAKTTSYFIFDEEGNRIGVEGIIMDTTDQFIAEHALKQAADIVNNIKLGIYIYQLEDPDDDRTLKMVAANPATEDLTGVPVSEVIGKTLDENFPGLREKGIPQMYADVVRSQKPIEIEDIAYEDERIILSAYSVKAFPLPNNQVGVSFENITQRKQTEEALRKSEEKHRQLIEIMNEGFAILNRNGIITYANKRLCEMMGYNCSEIIDRPTTDFLDKANIENMQKHVSSRTQGKSIPYEVEWLRKDGTVLPTIVSPMPLFDEAGEFSGNVAVLTDISELKRIENELIKKNEELEKTLKRANEMHAHLVIAEKMASLGQITAGVAHEIKNPLGYIKANIDPLQRDIHDLLLVLEKYDSIIHEQNIQSKFSEVETLKRELDFSSLLREIHMLLEGMKEGAGRTTQIVKSLGNFSRAGEEKLVMGDVHEGIDSTLTLLSGELGTRITVHKDYGELHHIECYPGKLNQVFMNILSNAIQAIEHQGEISIKTSIDKEIVWISIRDTGKGMPEEVRKRIFEPFFTTKEMGEGAGLGLAICYNIISQHNGKITVKSEPGLGTEFVLSLPVKQPADGQMQKDPQN